MPFSTRNKESITPYAIAGLVACGGASSRMGVDKSMLDYHGFPQRYFLYQLLEQCCENVFLSLNELQASTENPEFKIIVDADQYKNKGPISALMSFQKMHPGSSVLMLGCDYPNISLETLLDFLSTVLPENKSAAFASSDGNRYEPMLAFYHAADLAKLPMQFETGNYSLQTFLHNIEAVKYRAKDLSSLLNINTREAYNQFQHHLITEKHV